MHVHRGWGWSWCVQSPAQCMTPDCRLWSRYTKESQNTNSVMVQCCSDWYQCNHTWNAEACTPASTTSIFWCTTQKMIHNLMYHTTDDTQHLIQHVKSDNQVAQTTSSSAIQNNKQLHTSKMGRQMQMRRDESCTKYTILCKQRKTCSISGRCRSMVQLFLCVPWSCRPVVPSE